MEQELMRIGVSLPNNLLEKFDSIIEQRGYSSRSEGIRDAIRSYINYHEWMGDISGRRVGTITLIYDHTKRGLSNAIADAQHGYTDLIKTSIHIHLDPENCMEIIIFDGDGEKIKKLDENLISLKGVKYAKLNTTPPAEKL
ncbi:MAG: CopG family transcriptional regulator, nickel-responsive regulator [Methanohalophilus sp. T328-1]|jgi:CopG family nickel-responsive transcriptional regulator|uniref:Putative nickel-responsive regulator n=1 Tax=Methanohalophilus euhalobius TaxID=51203 RepID=A0A285FXJ2_9EURY|nr:MULTISPECIES: nickel-responsive transcriptional regulator NikR [Methanohalophilus]KXS46263.1 MAG: CopG family transcriptional regulator, nickel-responsive regulator [Methanohalophilus sp. T328-1]RSD36256.1 MAG: CopG family transcriptional regulator, nickel-responsive regulator [Methanohalophilus sp.]OBZ34591.1 MAG: nickel-responsive regulator [Methanohalophilus sp. DAL1]ODV50281.1 MAG: CopG family transcriptional regulator, nickel-responsive regulator [Methanohalophilus sp. 2-GBenrich]TCL11